MHMAQTQSIKTIKGNVGCITTKWRAQGGIKRVWWCKVVFGKMAMKWRPISCSNTNAISFEKELRQVLAIEWKSKPLMKWN